MPLSLRHRMFLGLLGLGTLPLAVALAVLVMHVRTTASPTGPRAALDEIAASGRATIAAIDTTRLDDTGRAAWRTHTEVIAQRTTLARRAETLSRTASRVLAVLVLGVAVVVLALSITTARRLSAYTSAPIEELVQWVRYIERGEPLPVRAAPGEAPEFDALRHAMHAMALALQDARHLELERERLAAFRETARRVAHEMRGPLTAARLAVGQLRSAERGTDAVAVLEDETRRLERMAREFSEFGRLPEGPETEIDLAELLDKVLATTAPDGCPVQRTLAPDLVIRGRYEALRRAFENIVANAVEATDERGIAVTACEEGGDAVRIRVTDHGPGVPAEDRTRIFEPYVTTKQAGTGLGLALARQTIVAHLGRIAVEPGESGGAAFVITLPRFRPGGRPATAR